mmetsp:Transcript_33891/g.69191  ORF Transcript_33891/g.69191 Transcript_33891/m.69191 type:complete len:95 (-) Transcript_33891:214-498(-)
MKVTIDKRRVFHLVLLVALTLIGGSALERRWGWSGLSAYGFVCTIVCQISGFVTKLLDGTLSEMLNGVDDGKDALVTKRDSKGNPKKKKRKKTS